MYSTSLIWALEDLNASFIAIKCKDAENAVAYFIKKAHEEMKKAFENLVEELDDELDEDDGYYPLGADEFAPESIVNKFPEEDGKDVRIVQFGPLYIQYCYGDFCEVNGACDAIDNAISETAEEYPDAEYVGYIQFPWSDRRCGDIVSYEVFSNKSLTEKPHWFLGTILENAVNNKYASGEDIPAEEYFSFLEKLKEEVEGNEDWDETRETIEALREYLSDDAAEKLLECVKEAEEACM